MLLGNLSLKFGPSLLMSTEPNENCIVVPATPISPQFVIITLERDMTSPEVHKMITELGRQPANIDDFCPRTKEGLLVTARIQEALHIIFPAKRNLIVRPALGEEECEMAILVADGHEFPAPIKKDRWLQGSMVICC